MSLLEQLKHPRRLLLGFCVAAAIAGLATYVGHLLPTVGAPIVAILVGILVRLALNATTGRALRADGRGAWIAALQPGVGFTSKRILQLAIILLGANLNLAAVWKTGSASFWVMVGSLAVALAGGTLIGRLLRLPTNLTRLIAVGTSICGASAISAVAPIVAAEESEIAYAISTIFLFNVIAVFLFPAIGHLAHFSSTQFGVWAGTAINDTSSVVAAGYAFSPVAGQYATVVKLTRSLAIIPVSLWFAIRSSRTAAAHLGSGDSVGPRRRRVRISFPLFILGFVAMSALDTLGVFGTAASALNDLGQYLIAVALAAIGLSTNLQSFRQTGSRPLLMGLCTWALVAVSSLALQALTR
ncbi:MAG: putative sulfate exporter family transporter [Alicyclobacillus sp.]|nr:putative sulfate exporter family transporter [Alicyclobacillus sp.]